MALIGTVDPYVPGTSFSNYVELIEYFFSSNNIEQDRKKDIFMSCCGFPTFAELKLLYPATDLRTLSYEEITRKLKERFDKVDSEIVLRYKFRSRKQGPSESGENFILGVKLLAEACDFGEFRDSAIRDQLVYGVFNKDVQHRLLDEDNLNLKMAEKIIKNKEITQSNALIINEDRHVNSVKYRLGRKSPEHDQSVYVGNGRGRSRFDRGNQRYNRSRSRSGQRSSSRGRNNRSAVKFVEEAPPKEKVHEYFKRLRVDYDSDSDSSGSDRFKHNLGSQGADSTEGRTSTPA
ncbi:uncharacterized protein LOC134227649 [Armigeres subalbatus]|uniref:uncharacterized protein LOC134227649 n=1 Tax=Armigeres subalbatus TaxID=124917 RepID=UPI002ED133B2